MSCSDIDIDQSSPALLDEVDLFMYDGEILYNNDNGEDGVPYKISWPGIL